MELQVLFIGNSHTFLHYMPQMLTELVRAAGRGVQLHAEQGVGDGASLEWHWNHAATQAKIAARGRWKTGNPSNATVGCWRQRSARKGRGRSFT